VPAFTGPTVVHNSLVPNPEVGQFAGDGLSDLAYQSGNTIHVLRNDGNASFTDLASVLDVSTAIPVSTLAGFVAGDFNGDGKSDLLVSTGNALHTFTGNGDGLFTRVGSSPIYADTPAINHIVVGKVNADNSPDIVVSYGDLGQGQGQGVTLLGNGNGTFTRVNGTYTSGTMLPKGLGDFNGDGTTDLLATVPNGVETYYGDNSGKFLTRNGSYFIQNVSFAQVGNFTRSPASDVAFYQSVNAPGATVLSFDPDGTGYSSNGGSTWADRKFELTAFLVHLNSGNGSSQKR